MLFYLLLFFGVILYNPVGCHGYSEEAGKKQPSKAGNITRAMRIIVSIYIQKNTLRILLSETKESNLKMSSTC